MCIFEHGKAQFEGTPTEKNHLFPDLVRNLAIVPVHAIDLPFELFPDSRTLVRWLSDDDDAVCPVVMPYIPDLLGFSASEASAFTLDRVSARLWFYR